MMVGLAFTPDGKGLISWGGRSLPDAWVNKASVWDTATGKIAQILNANTGLVYIAIAPDGKTVALGTLENTIQIWDMVTGRKLFADEEGPKSAITSLDYPLDGKTLASAGDGPVFLWDASSWKRSGVVPGNAHTVSFSPDGKQLAVVGDSMVRSWDMVAGQEAGVLTLPQAPRWRSISACYSSDGRKLFTLEGIPKRPAGETFVRHWDVATAKEERVWVFPCPPYPRALTPDGKTVVGTTIDPRLISIYHVESRRHRLMGGELLPGDRGIALSVSPDGRVLASGESNDDSAVRLWEVMTGKEMFVMNGHLGALTGIESPTTAVAWSVDGRLLASGDGRAYRTHPMVTQTIRVWDTATGKEWACFGGFKTDVTALAFSKDCKQLSAGLRDGTILIFDTSKLTSDSIPASSLDKKELESCWADLLGDDADKAHRAIGSLVAAPKQSVPFLLGRLKPIVVADRRIQQWIADLDSATFATRQAAVKQLEKLGDRALGPLKKALNGNVGLEARRRLEQILNNMSDMPGPETVRTVRAIMVLERIGTPEARAVLESLTRGAHGARETEEAKASLERLAWRESRVR